MLIARFDFYQLNQLCRTRIFNSVEASFIKINQLGKGLQLLV